MLIFSTDPLLIFPTSTGLAAILAACISSGLAGGWFEYILKTPYPPPESLPPSNTTTPSTTPLSTPSKKILPDSDKSPSTSSTPVRSFAPVTIRQKSPSLWARNLQLSIPSLCFSLAGILLSPDRHQVLHGGLLQGFTPLVWSVVLNQALGGLIVAMVVKECDSVAKGFATSIAILGT